MGRKGQFGQLRRPSASPNSWESRDAKDTRMSAGRRRPCAPDTGDSVRGRDFTCSHSQVQRPKSVVPEGIKWSRNITPWDSGLTPGSLWSLTGRLSPGSEPCQTSLCPIFPPATAPFQGAKGKLCASSCFTTFVSLPTFKMPNAATCPGGSNFVSYPECHRRNSLQTPLTDRFLLHRHPPACQASKTKGLTSASPRPRLSLVLTSQAATFRS